MRIILRVPIVREHGVHGLLDVDVWADKVRGRSRTYVHSTMRGRDKILLGNKVAQVPRSVRGPADIRGELAMTARGTIRGLAVLHLPIVVVCNILLVILEKPMILEPILESLNDLWPFGRRVDLGLLNPRQGAGEW